MLRFRRRPYVRTVQLIVLISAVAGVVGPSRALDDGRYLPANTWVRLTTVPTERFVPKAYSDCTQVRVLSHPVGRRASSIVYGDGIAYWGGGGQSYPANDVEWFDIASSTWTQQAPPECLPACCVVDKNCAAACSVSVGGTTALTPLGRPYVEHAYQLITYNPLRQRYTAALTSGLWEWDRGSGEWTQLTPDRPLSTDPATKMLVYDPDLETVLYFATTQYNHTVFRFDYTTNTWVPHSPIPTQIAWADIFSAYDTREHKHLVSHGTGTMWIYDASALTWTQLQDVPAEVRFSYSMAYDQATGEFLLGRTDSANRVQLYSYRTAADAWTRLELADGPTGPTRDYNGLVYDQSWKRFYFLNVRAVGGGGEGGSGATDVETWAFRIGGSAGPGDANCDGSLTAGDLSGLLQRLGSNPADGCGAVDVDRDGTVSDADVFRTLRALFEAPP
jgi:hypothetical protein